MRLTVERPPANRQRVIFRSPDPDDPDNPVAPRIALVRFSSMGDILLTTPLLRAIRRRHPDAWMTYVTKAEFVPLLETNPRLNEIIGFRPTTPLADLARRLAAGGYTHFLDLHGSLRSRALAARVGSRWGRYPKHRFARGVLIRLKRDIYRDRRHVAERYFDAARELDVTPDDGPLEFFLKREALDSARKFLADQRLDPSSALVALVPGAAHATKQWPVRHWQHLVAMLTTHGHEVVVLGGPKEQALCEEVAVAGGDHATSAGGRFDLGGTAALLKLARCAVAGDTGPMHLATAVGTPVVALYGPTVQPFGFFPYRARATVLERDLDCRPCSAMGGPVCPLKHHRCLEDIAPDVVFDAVRRLPR
jgi:heptosyltransferase-2